MTDNEKVRLEVVIDQKDAAIADAEARLKVYRTVIDDYSSQVRLLRKENSYYHSRITELEDTVMRLGEDNRLLREDARKSCARITELEDALVRLGADKPSLGHNLGLQAENERLKVELEASRGQVRGQLGIILDLREELADYKRLYDTLGDSLAREFAKTTKLQEENERLKNDRTSLVGEADELYAKLGRIKTIIDEIMD